MLVSDQIQKVLSEMYRLNAVTPTLLVGGAYYAEIAREPDELPWIQAKVGVLNIYYPFADPPLQRIAAAGVPLPGGVTCSDWKPESFATLEFPPPALPQLATLVEALFNRLYGFDDTFTAKTELVDMR